MEKTAQKKTYRDPAMNKIVQEKAAWNKQVSALINDLIHFKKSMNGWPSKYYKERTRITQPVPVDLSSILNQIAGDFQEIASRGNGILEEQAGFSKAHLKRKTDQTLNRLEQTHGPVDVPKAPPTPGAAPDLAQQLGKGASKAEVALTKLASDFEDKYFLESQASNPLTRFVTRLFNPKFGFGEGARMRRLRMTMLDNCVNSLKTLKRLQTEIVKSSDSSLENSHKMMSTAWNQWNIVNRLFDAYRTLKPEKGQVRETGGKIENPDLKNQKDSIENEMHRDQFGTDLPDETQDPREPQDAPEFSVLRNNILLLIRDYELSANYIGSVARNAQFRNLVSHVERLKALPKDRKPSDKTYYDLMNAYISAIDATNQELKVSGSNLQDIVQQHQHMSKKEAQGFRGFLGKTRHQILPGGTSGPRLEIYNLIEQVKKDMNHLMDLLEDGFEREKIQTLISQVNRQMSSIRTMVRSLFYSVRPDKATYSFF